MAPLDANRLRNDRFRCTVWVEGVGTFNDPFDTCTGGDSDSDETKYRPGGMAASVSLGGMLSTSNVVVSRNYAIGRDDIALSKLRAVCGQADASVTLQPLGKNRQASGQAQVFRGVLQRVQGPQHDSNSTDAAMIELEIAPGGVVV